MRNFEIFLLAAILICTFSTRRYLATAEVQVQKEASSQLGLDATGGGESSYSDAVQDNITIQTQANILQSDSLALKVIHATVFPHYLSEVCFIPPAITRRLQRRHRVTSSRAWTQEPIYLFAGSDAGGEKAAGYRYFHFRNNDYQH